MILLALGIVILQIVRHQVEVLYSTTLIARSIILVCLCGLYFYYSRSFLPDIGRRRRAWICPDGHRLLAQPTRIALMHVNGTTEYRYQMSLKVTARLNQGQANPWLSEGG